MASAGLRSPELVLHRLRSDDGRAEWAARTGIDAGTLRAHFERVRLVMHRGIGDQRAAQLAEIGVHRVEDLQRWTAEDLAARLRTGDPRDRFLERRVRAWRAGL
jgi:nucleotidyltransferase/DNA polymerase involved in DNA repair